MENAVSKGEQYSFDFMGRIFSDRSINKYKDRSFNRTTRIMYIDLLSWFSSGAAHSSAASLYLSLPPLSRVLQIYKIVPVSNIVAAAQHPSCYNSRLHNELYLQNAEVLHQTSWMMEIIMQPPYTIASQVDEYSLSALENVMIV